jgi:hypothetical protein
MTVNTSIQVVGVKEALKEIHKVNPALRKEITREYRKIVQPAIDTIIGKIPTLAPLSGMEQPWSPKRRGKSGKQITIQPWNKGEFGKSIVAKINTRKAYPKFMGNEVSAAFRIVTNYGWGLAADMGGKRSQGSTEQGRIMLAVLRSRFGDASRFMWPGWFQAFPEVEQNMRKLCERIMREVHRRIVWVGA